MRHVGNDRPRSLQLVVIGCNLGVTAKVHKKVVELSSELSLVTLVDQRLRLIFDDTARYCRRYILQFVERTIQQYIRVVQLVPHLEDGSCAINFVLA